MAEQRPNLVVHMIGNAHLDPVWLWTWPAGLDEAISTCRTGCDLLDEYPNLVITRGEAWIHEQIKEHAPDLFERIKRHADAGRWQAVNGWWIQPDCNLPTAESFRKQGEIGKRWFRENLGVDVTVGYNVDSFGHCATLPQFLREAGMDSYCFMRPGPHEKALPANLFTWEAPSGDSVTAWRLCGGYGSAGVWGIEQNVKHAVEHSDRSLGHTMCFYGIGDHGGGPSREQVEWIIEHARYADGVELRFSHPRAFLDAVNAAGPGLPVVKDELQYHAIGCYSVVHGMKQEMRRAEALLAQAERLIRGRASDATSSAEPRLDEAWRRVLFNQFHDILAGSSIKPAYEHVRDELGLAKATARDIIVGLTRRELGRLPASQRQQLLLTNTSDRPFKGYVECEPWLGYSPGKTPHRLTDKAGNAVPSQDIIAEAACNGRLRLLVRAEVPALGATVLEVHPEPAQPLAEGVRMSEQSLSNALVSADLDRRGLAALRLGEQLIAGGIRIAAFEDKSDTWSHGISGFTGAERGVFEATGPWAVLEQGPLRITMVNEFQLGPSSLVWRVFVQEGEPIVRMRLRLHWHGVEQIVKLLIPARVKPAGRVDGCPGGLVKRPLNGWEYPVHNVLSLHAQKGGFLAAVSADIYAGDVQPDGTIRLTLLRSPLYAYHDPFKAPPVHAYPATDQGEHEYEIALLMADGPDDNLLADEVSRQANQVWFCETTRGMARR